MADWLRESSWAGRQPQSLRRGLCPGRGEGVAAASAHARCVRRADGGGSHGGSVREVGAAQPPGLGVVSEVRAPGASAEKGRGPRCRCLARRLPLRLGEAAPGPPGLPGAGVVGGSSRRGMHHRPGCPAGLLCGWAALRRGRGPRERGRAAPGAGGKRGPRAGRRARAVGADSLLEPSSRPARSAPRVRLLSSLEPAAPALRKASSCVGGAGPSLCSVGGAAQSRVSAEQPLGPPARGAGRPVSACRGRWPRGGAPGGDAGRGVIAAWDYVQGDPGTEQGPPGIPE